MVDPGNRPRPPSSAHGHRTANAPPTPRLHQSEGRSGRPPVSKGLLLCPTQWHFPSYRCSPLRLWRSAGGSSPEGLAAQLRWSHAGRNHRSAASRPEPQSDNDCTSAGEPLPSPVGCTRAIRPPYLRVGINATSPTTGRVRGSVPANRPAGGKTKRLMTHPTLLIRGALRKRANAVDSGNLRGSSRCQTSAPTPTSPDLGPDPTCFTTAARH
jgi:hypothetical protein